MSDVVLVHSAGHMPDVWTDVVRALPTGWKAACLGVMSVGPNLSVTTLEQYLDKQELRRVVLVGHGTGAVAATQLAQAQPQRVTHVLQLVPDTPRFVPGFLRRRQEQALEAPVPTRRAALGPADAAAVVAQLQELVAEP